MRLYMRKSLKTEAIDRPDGVVVNSDKDGAAGEVAFKSDAVEGHDAADVVGVLYEAASHEGAADLAHIVDKAADDVDRDDAAFTWACTAFEMRAQAPCSISMRM